MAEVQRKGGSLLPARLCNIRVGLDGSLGAVQCKKSCKSSAMVLDGFIFTQRKRALSVFSYRTVLRYAELYVFTLHLYIHTKHCKLRRRKRKRLQNSLSS